VADEAYIDFGGESALAILDSHPNLVVTRTFSKSFSLAGLRLGLAMASPGLIAELAKVKDSYNVSRLAAAAGVAALEDYAWMEANVARVCATLDRVRAGLLERGWQVPESVTNFLWCLPPAGASGASVYRRLRERRILVRWFDHPLLTEGVRVSIGTDAQMDRFLAAIDG
jgi:histidinol-phosphate aminotransferase